MNGAGDIGEYLIEIVTDKTISKPAPPPPAAETPKVESEAPNGTGAESAKSPENEKVEGPKPEISEKGSAVAAEGGAAVEVPSKT